MKLRIEIDLNTETLMYTEIATAIRKSLTLYHDAVSIGGPPAVEDAGVIVDGLTGKQIGKWETIEDEPAPAAPELQTFRVIMEMLIEAKDAATLQARIDDETPGQIMESASDIDVRMAETYHRLGGV